MRVPKTLKVGPSVFLPGPLQWPLSSPSPVHIDVVWLWLVVMVCLCGTTSGREEVGDLSFGIRGIPSLPFINYVTLGKLPYLSLCGLICTKGLTIIFTY